MLFPATYLDMLQMACYWHDIVTYILRKRIALADHFIPLGRW